MGEKQVVGHALKPLKTIEITTDDIAAAGELWAKDAEPKMKRLLDADPPRENEQR